LEQPKAATKAAERPEAKKYEGARLIKMNVERFQILYLLTSD
jgi:hypothetical protein